MQPPRAGGVWCTQSHAVYPPPQPTREVRAAPFACCQTVDVHPVAGAHAGAAEWPGANGVAVLRFRTVAPQTPHLAVGTIHHLDELAHPKQNAGELSSSDDLHISITNDSNDFILALNVQQVWLTITLDVGSPTIAEPNPRHHKLCEGREQECYPSRTDCLYVLKVQRAKRYFLGLAFRFIGRGKVTARAGCAVTRHACHFSQTRMWFGCRQQSAVNCNS